ncbi:MAG: oxygen-independent coproporphyrinogen III oxidase [Pseudomonadota bacterium]
MDQDFSSYATRSVPRYTSYPTAPHFSDSVGPVDYARWLQALDPADPVSLYLHVPYCREICWYCGCNMKLAKREDTILSYAATLMREIRLLARHLPGRMTVSHLHWGGGTPTVLSPDALTLAMETIRSDFEIADGAELALESDPRSLSDQMIARIGALGFTRASFGVQEFDPTVQLAINRIQPPDMVHRSVEGLREVGVSGINFDLIYGLPHQTVDTLARTIELCGEMRPDRIALFGYAHVPWVAKKQRMIDQSALPGASERLAQAKMAAQEIQSQGYVPIGLDHFALPTDPLAIAARTGTLRRNFQGYTTDTATALLGLGATSIGRTPQGYMQNIPETGAWSRAVNAGQLPVAKGIALSGDDRLRASVIEALMCHARVDLAEIARMHDAPVDWYEDLEDDLQLLLQDGLLTRTGAQISMNPKATHLVRVLAAVFDAYIDSQEKKHSVAV